MIKSTLLLSVLLLFACSVFASPGASIVYYHPIEFSHEPRIQTVKYRRTPFPFPHDPDRTAIHEAIERLFSAVSKIEALPTDMPSLKSVEIRDGIVIVNSARRYRDTMHARRVMRVCLKLTIEENLRWKDSPTHNIPEIKGFVVRYGGGWQDPVDGYYAVSPFIVTETMIEPGDAENGGKPLGDERTP